MKPVSRKTGLKRLAKLAEHLERGKLGHKKFNFAIVNGDREGHQMETNGCGYCGCALGEAPFVFPSLFYFGGGWPRIRGTGFVLDTWHAREFFALEAGESSHLFLPCGQDTARFGGQFLNGFATRKQVARNIRAFIAKMESK